MRARSRLFRERLFESASLRSRYYVEITRGASQLGLDEAISRSTRNTDETQTERAKHFVIRPSRKSGEDSTIK
jgi:hypothetical protein